uniref:F-box domain-containing protein n=1 Tax=Mycena chlorophos TaxID=658473 RepID=A0ABQ0LJD5_MYCCL|nr:predicted protein [Mycena chlorophos]
MLDVLPLELVVEIFRLCLPEGHHSIDSRSFHREAPVLLTQICSSWRKVAISTPSLWSNFHVFFGFHPQRTEHLARLFLPRSRSYPLNLGIHLCLSHAGGHVSQFALQGALDSFLQTIKEHAHHARNFELSAESLRQLVRFEKEGMSFPMVESLKVAFDDWDIRDDEWPMMASFASARNLRKLYLESLPLSRLGAPLENITDVIALSHNLQQTIYMLAHLPALEHMYLQAKDGAETHLLPINAPIVLPCLSNFEMSCDFAQHLLPLLTLPALKELVISSLSNSDGLSSSTLESLLDRSLCSLKRLQLWTGEVQELPSVSAFKRSNWMMLEELSFALPEKSSLQRFCDAYGADATFLPKLQKLEFICGSHPLAAGAGECLEQLGPVVARRMANDEPWPLRALKVVWSEYDAGVYGFLANDELHGLFTMLKGRGVDVYIGAAGGDETSWI